MLNQFFKLLVKGLLSHAAESVCYCSEYAAENLMIPIQFEFYRPPIKIKLIKIFFNRKSKRRIILFIL